MATEQERVAEEQIDAIIADYRIKQRKWRALFNRWKDTLEIVLIFIIIVLAFTGVYLIYHFLG
jgi:succinate dehydrogenase hydrophobic anchor subunit